MAPKFQMTDVIYTRNIQSWPIILVHIFSSSQYVDIGQNELNIVQQICISSYIFDPTCGAGWPKIIVVGI